MKKTLFILLSWFMCAAFPLQSRAQIDPVKFFETDTALDATLRMDITRYVRSATNPQYQPATFTCRIADSIVSEQVRIIARGNARRKICYMPPIKMDFHNATSPKLYPLNSLKLVCACNQNDTYDQLLLKEYLIYKIYNLITDKSFRVRLLNLSYEDAAGKKKTVSAHAFFLEDEKELAKRNDCKALKNMNLSSESTNRSQMTIVAIFEYMIGNTDWGVSLNHNTVLMRPAKDSAALPFVVPYDFDYSGFVDAAYAVPNEALEIEKVQQRLYRGFPRTADELNDAFIIFNKQKDNIYALVKNFNLLTKKNRDDIIDYLDEFYETINNSKQVKDIFIDHATGN